MMKIYKVRIGAIGLSLCMLILMLLVASNICARSKEAGEDEAYRGSDQAIVTNLPNAQQRVHRVPDVQMCVTNWGFLGSKCGDLNESMGGCFNPNPGVEMPAPSFEYPPGSGIDYLFQGGIWIGAKVDGNIYTSVGCDGWFWIYELWPDADCAGAIWERSVRPDVSCYNPDAISQQDVIAVYTDTSADIPLSPDDRDDWDDRKHFPLDVRITQQSFSWDIEGWDKFIIAEYTIQNIGIKKIKDMYMGLYVDADALHKDENPYGPFGAQDDITGFLRNYEVSPGDVREVNIAWAADNDGHGRSGETGWTEVSPRSVLGIKVLRAPHPQVQMSYNWWVSNMAGHPRDWGPWIADNQDAWESMNPYGSGNLFPGDMLGTPGGDVSKYFIMSNGEFDYDQIYSCEWPDDHPEDGWLPPSPECMDLANGYDTRFLLSFGPFDQLAPGDSLIVAVAYVIGESLHVDPLNLVNDPNMSDPDAYYANLYFADLVNNALRAESVYYSFVRNYPPDPFSLLFPPKKAFTPRVVRFDWEDASDPNPLDEVRYDLYISTSYYFLPAFTTIYYNLSVSEYIKRLEDDTYFWKVKAKDNRGAERWSNQVRYFYVTGIPYMTIGDLNGDESIDIGDVVFSINYLYRSEPAPDPLERGDVNCDSEMNIGDVVFLINYLFKGGPSPCIR